MCPDSDVGCALASSPTMERLMRGSCGPDVPTLRSQARSPRLSARNLRKDEKLLFSGTSLKLTVRKAGDNPSRHYLFRAMFRAAFRSASSENPHDTHLNSCVRTPSDFAVFNLFSAEMLPHKGHACEV